MPLRQIMTVRGANDFAVNKAIAEQWWEGGTLVDVIFPHGWAGGVVLVFEYPDEENDLGRDEVGAKFDGEAP